MIVITQFILVLFHWINRHNHVNSTIKLTTQYKDEPFGFSCVLLPEFNVLQVLKCKLRYRHTNHKRQPLFESYIFRKVLLSL